LRHCLRFVSIVGCAGQSAHTLLACHGRVQREGEVIHVITDRIEDLSGLLRSVGEREEALVVRPGRDDEARHGGGSDPRGGCGAGAREPAGIGIPDPSPGGGIKVPTRDFR
jgi:error-prone DNA polymerase